MRTFGLLPSHHHIAHKTYFNAAPVPTQPVFSLRPKCSAPYDQGATGSCTGQSTAKILELRRAMEGKPLAEHPSQYYLYANARMKEGTLGQDSGASIADVATAATEDGFCLNSLWRDDPDQLLTHPSVEAYNAAKPEIGLTWSWIEQHGSALIASLKTAIANGDPILAGIQVYSSFMGSHVARTGMVPVPHWYESLEGGHAIALVGWNDHNQTIEFANSWGMWGDRGFGHLSYSYITNHRLASDFAAIQNVA